MTLKLLYKKLFISGDWGIAYRYKTHNDFYHDSFVSIPNTKEYWFADPLLLEAGNHTYIFCEAFNRKTLKGELGYFDVSNNCASEFRRILSPNYHLSYPNVFYLDGRYYMIPESSENNTVELYEAESFPDKWVKVKTLIDNVNYVDPTLLFIEDEILCFIYVDKKDKYETRIYKFDQDTLDLKYETSIYYKENIGRAAGQFFNDENGKLYRPVQLGEGEYGKRTAVNEINIDSNRVIEKISHIVDNENIIINGHKGVDKLHTYSRVGPYESIDYVIYKFDFFKRLKILFRKYKLEIRKKSSN